MNMFIKRFAKVPVMQLPASRPGRDGLRGRGEEGPLVAKKENNNQPGVNRSRRKLRRILIPLLILAILAGVCTAYLTTYYPADETAIQAFSADYTVEEHVLENGDLTFGTGHEDYGWIFYPGGKVAEDAYAPLMCRLAANGVFCVICKMPCHLAVLDDLFGMLKVVALLLNLYLSLANLLVAEFYFKRLILDLLCERIKFTVVLHIVELFLIAVNACLCLDNLATFHLNGCLEVGYFRLNLLDTGVQTGNLIFQVLYFEGQFTAQRTFLVDGRESSL